MKIEKLNVSFCHLLVGCLLAVLCLAAGCATGPKQQTGAHVFFPPPPDEPRIQFLMSFSSESDLGTGSTFTDFVVGKDKVHRPIVKPYGMATTPGQIFVCDTTISAVEIVDLAKRRIHYFKPGGEATLGTPINIAIDTDGTRYITDTRRNQVLIFAKDERYLGALGARDEMRPVGVAVSSKRLYVTDLNNHCLRVYDKANRELLFTVPRDGDDERAQLFGPTNVALDPAGNIYVSDTRGFFVNVYDPEGKYIRTIGEQGLSPGKFSLPKGIAVDRAGRVYVVDANTQVIQLFDEQGRILMYFGDPRAAGGGATSLPAGVAIDYENVGHFQKYAAPGFKLEYVILVSNQTGNQRVSVFGFGQKQGSQ
jgi:DNA-binding beta-propeller fold protein YncE